MKTDNVIFDITNKYRYFRLSDNDIDLIIEELINLLNSMNLNIIDLKKITEGESSIVYEINDLIIKISFLTFKNKTSAEYFNKTKKVLMPLKEKIVNVDYFLKPVLSIQEKLDTTYINDLDIINTYIDLRNDGYLWNDTKKENLGKNKFGDVLLIDYGEITNINDLSYEEREQAIKKHRIVKEELDDIYRSGNISIPYQKENYIKRLIRKMNW